MKILFADDEKGIADQVETILKRDGHEVIIVNDGESAWEMLRAYESAFDLLITDVRMGALDGIALLERVFRTQVGVPVVVLTGHGDMDTAVRALQNGALDFINKPFGMADLRGALKKAEYFNMGGVSRTEAWPLWNENISVDAKLIQDAPIEVVDRIVAFLRASMKRRGLVLRTLSDPLLLMLEVAGSVPDMEVRIAVGFDGDYLQLLVCGINGHTPPFCQADGELVDELQRGLQAYNSTCKATEDRSGAMVRISV